MLELALLLSSLFSLNKDMNWNDKFEKSGILSHFKGHLYLPFSSLECLWNLDFSKGFFSLSYETQMIPLIIISTFSTTLHYFLRPQWSLLPTTQLFRKLNYGSLQHRYSTHDSHQTLACKRCCKFSIKLTNLALWTNVQYKHGMQSIRDSNMHPINQLSMCEKDRIFTCKGRYSRSELHIYVIISYLGQNRNPMFWSAGSNLPLAGDSAAILATKCQKK